MQEVIHETLVPILWLNYSHCIWLDYSFINYFWTTFIRVKDGKKIQPLMTSWWVYSILFYLENMDEIWKKEDQVMFLFVIYYWYTNTFVKFCYMVETPYLSKMLNDQLTLINRDMTDMITNKYQYKGLIIRG